MPALPPNPARTHIDQDTDDVAAARANIDAMAQAIASINAYLIGLFGSSGDKGTAWSTLTSGQTVSFPAGTTMYFCQATPPIGWTIAPIDQERYLAATPHGTGGNNMGNYAAVLGTSAISLVQAHLPAITLTGTTDWHGGHGHGVSGYAMTDQPPYSFFGTNWQPNEGAVGLRLTPITGTWVDGQHYHNVSVPLGGSGAPHSHLVDLSAYRPAGVLGVLASKN